MHLDQSCGHSLSCPIIHGQVPAAWSCQTCANPTHENDRDRIGQKRSCKFRRKNGLKWSCFNPKSLIPITEVGRTLYLPFSHLRLLISDIQPVLAALALIPVSKSHSQRHINHLASFRMPVSAHSRYWDIEYLGAGADSRSRTLMINLRLPYSHRRSRRRSSCGKYVGIPIPAHSVGSCGCQSHSSTLPVQYSIKISPQKSTETLLSFLELGSSHESGAHAWAGQSGISSYRY